MTRGLGLPSRVRPCESGATALVPTGMLLRFAVVATLAAAIAPRAGAAPPHFAPRTDARGYIDVWRLRRDIAAVEARYVLPGGSADVCADRRAADRHATAAERTRAAQAERRCERGVLHRQAASVAAVAAFNKAWRPVIVRAMQRGDPIAEVILRDCDTTPLLDRRGIAATCDPEPERAEAIARLHAIGFMPAVPIRFQDWQRSRQPDAARLANQELALEAIRNGALGLPLLDIMADGNGVRSDADLAWQRNWAVIDAALQDAPRAFTVTPGLSSAGWKTSAFARLRLDRAPLTPGFLTFGRAKDYRGSTSIWTPSGSWRSAPMTLFDVRTPVWAKIRVSGRDVTDFRATLAATLAVLDANIDTWLRRDPRWAVFLLRRVGYNEWVPEGMRTATGRINPVWLGRWRLVAQTPDWNQPLQPARGDAVIGYRRNAMVIRTKAASPLAVMPDVSDCTLRYSGGVTYLPDPAAERNTALGDYKGAYAAEALAALNPHLRYKQVLMQCEGAESDDSDRVRFLLHARDRMIEIGAPDSVSGLFSDGTARFAVRVYRRVR